MHNHISPLFFPIGTRFSTHLEFQTRNMILSSKILFNFFFSNGSNFKCIFLVYVDMVLHLVP
jgi:hypothetical protein